MTTKKILTKSLAEKVYATVISAGIFMVLDIAAAHANVFIR